MEGRGREGERASTNIQTVLTFIYVNIAMSLVYDVICTTLNSERLVCLQTQ